MARKITKIKQDSVRWRICALAVFCGELPYRAVKLLSPSVVSAEKAARTLVEQGLLREDVKKMQNERIRSLKPTAELLSGEKLFPDMVESYKKAALFSSAGTKVKTSRRRLRSLRSAEAAAFMMGCGANVIPGTKEPIRTFDTQDSAAYYTSRELSESVTQDQKYRCTGRATGYLTLPDGRIYQVYSLHTSNIVIQQVREQETLSVANIVFSRDARPAPVQDAIILGSSMSLMNSIISESDTESRYVEGKRQTRLRIAQERYRKQHFFPKTKEGLLNAQLLLLAGSRKIKYWSIGEMPDESSYEDIYYSDSGHILSIADGDMLKLKRFIFAAKDRPEEKFMIGCFEYQKETLADLVKDSPNISFAAKSPKITDVYEEILACEVQEAEP